MTSEKPSLPHRYSEEEVAELLQRATELQRAGPGSTIDEGLTLRELEEIADEAGIPARYVRRAAAELGTGAPSTDDLWSKVVGASLTLSFERSLAVEIEPDDLAGFVPLMEAASLGQGSASLVGGTLTWTSRSDTDTSSQQISVTTGRGGTVVRAEERLGGLAAALHGGLIGGVGGGVGVGGGIALGSSIGSAALAVALPVAVVGASYAAARWIYSYKVRTRRERLETLVNRLTERVESLGGTFDGEAEAG